MQTQEQIENFLPEEKAFHERKLLTRVNFAHKYETEPLWRNHWNRIMKRVRLSFPSAIKILNLGSGRGAAEFLLRKGKNSIVSVDISYNAVSNIREFGLNNLVVNCDVSKLPFKNSSFNGILALNILHHLSDIRGCLAESVRVFKDDAIFLGLEPLETKTRTIIKKIFEERWRKSHSPYEKDLIMKDFRFLKNYKEISSMRLKAFSPLIPLFKLKFPNVIRKMIEILVSLDILLEKLGIGWLHFISFKVTKSK